MLERKRPIGEDVQVVAPPKASGPKRAVDLLAEFEEFIGRPLEKLDTPIIIPIKDGVDATWQWSWDAEVCAAFLAEWDSSIFVMHKNLRELATTPAPGKRNLMYELACSPAVRQRIDGVLAATEAPEGNIPPIPTGPYNIDLRGHANYQRPGEFVINSWRFYGVVKGISKDMYDQLAEMLGRYVDEGFRLTRGDDHEDVDLGRVRA
jgi:hypothetical protein